MVALLAKTGSHRNVSWPQMMPLRVKFRPRTICRCCKVRQGHKHSFEDSIEAPGAALPHLKVKKTHRQTDRRSRMAARLSGREPKVQTGKQDSLVAVICLARQTRGVVWVVCQKHGGLECTHSSTVPSFSKKLYLSRFPSTTANVEYPFNFMYLPSKDSHCPSETGLSRNRGPQCKDEVHEMKSFRYMSSSIKFIFSSYPLSWRFSSILDHEYLAGIVPF